MEIIFSRIFKTNVNISIFLLSTIINLPPTFSSAINEEIRYQTSSKSEYILGPGDTLSMRFEGLKFFDGFYTVNDEGNLIIPEIGEYSVNKKTISEIRRELNKKYSEFIYKPNVLISIYKKRAVNVTLRGEANRIGLFVFDHKDNEIPSIRDNFSNFDQYSDSLNLSNNLRESFQTAPRLFDLIKKSEGVTSNADLSKIEVIRINSLSNGGGKVKAKINLLALIQEGDQTQNIILHDGDDVFIPKTDKMLIDQIVDLNKSNLYSDKMEVFINGNVFRPGRIILRQGTSLIEAIAASGGKKNLTGKIEFVRLKRNGTTEKRLISFNESSLKGSKNNPILINGDMIFVRRNVIGKAGNFIVDYTSPLVNGYGVYKIFE